MKRKHSDFATISLNNFHFQEVILSISTRFMNMSFPRDLESDISKESIVQVTNKLAKAMLVKVPNDIKFIFGEDDIEKIFKHLLSSREIKKINLDLNLQILDVLASQLLISCRTNHESIAHQ